MRLREFSLFPVLWRAKSSSPGMQLHWPWSAAVEPPADAQAGRCTSYVCPGEFVVKKTQGRGPSHFESSGLPLTVRAVDGANCCHSDIQCSLALTSWRLDSRTLPWLTQIRHQEPPILRGSRRERLGFPQTIRRERFSQDSCKADTCFRMYLTCRCHRTCFRFLAQALLGKDTRKRKS